MKHTKFFLLLVIISISLNIILCILYLNEKKETQQIRNTWVMSNNNAIFLYEQFLEKNIDEAYYFANGEIGTMVNLMPNIDDFSKDDFAKEYFLGFYECLVTYPQNMKENINKIIEILKLLQQSDYNAFYLIKEIVDKELDINESDLDFLQ